MVASITKPSWPLLGFLPKRVAPGTTAPAMPGVEVIASGSECISRGPTERLARWLHNEIGLYDDEAAARAVIPGGEVAPYTLFAYCARPVCLRESAEEPFEPWFARKHAPPSADLARYELLGYDAVGIGPSGFFECSPLSCDGVGATAAVNRFCLVETPERADALARAFSRSESRAEPAWAYLVVQVLRRRRATPDAR